MNTDPNDEQLFKGVNKANPPSHDHLVPRWTPPEPPAGFRNLVALLVPFIQGGGRSFEWSLDYLNTETSEFASEALTLDVPWPWTAGFKPQAQDWDSIGIPHLM